MMAEQGRSLPTFLFNPPNVSPMPAFNLLNKPGSSGVLIVCGDTKEALLALKLALETATVA